MKVVDDEQSGQIEFAEFMKIISTVNENESDESAIYVFFKSFYFIKKW